MLVIFIVSCASPKKSQNTPEKVEFLLEAKSFTFAVYTVNSGALTTNGGKDDMITINNNTVSARLPYMYQDFQRGNPQAGFMTFTSEKFSYDKKTGLKSGWTLAVIPEDNYDIKGCQFDVLPNGSATLVLTSVKNGTITYSGLISNAVQKPFVRILQ